MGIIRMSNIVNNVKVNVVHVNQLIYVLLVKKIIISRINNVICRVRIL